MMSQNFIACVRAITFRATLGCLTVGLFVLSYSPYSWPTYVFYMVPMIAMWRGPLASKSVTNVLIESLALGYAMGWLATPFFAHGASNYSNGECAHSLCCIIFSLQTVGEAIAIWVTRNWRIVLAAPLIAFIGLLCEIVHSHSIGITWVGVNPALAVAKTPIAQWSSTLTPFGLSFLLSWVNCLWLPDLAINGMMRWVGTNFAAVAWVMLWFGGLLIESKVHVEPLPFAVMLVQPHDPASDWKTLNHYTINNLHDCGGVDLVVWPETSLASCYYSEFARAIAESFRNSDLDERMTIDRFRRELLAQYVTNCLVGATVRDRVSEWFDDQYTCTEVDYAFNCGCLITANADVQCHEKQVLMPISETSINWLDWFPQLRSILLPGAKFQAPAYKAGRRFHPLTFEDREGVTRRIAAAICYESWFPWLPQYHCKEPLDAICHLAYDGDFKDHPEYTQRMLLSIRLRAIETRTWQLVCSHYAGTAVIDPRGRIVKQLPPGPGVLRTDQLE